MKFQIDENVELRPPSAEDAEKIFAAVKQNYEHLRPFLHWVAPEFSIESTREFISRSSEAAREKTSLSLSIFYDEKLIGAIGFVKFDLPSRNTEIGYWIDKNFEGKGIITKSCRKLIDYAFNDLQMNRIEIHCAAENTKSRAVPERLGFTLEGILRQAQWRHTRFYDMAIYGMLAKEWRR